MCESDWQSRGLLSASSPLPTHLKITLTTFARLHRSEPTHRDPGGPATKLVDTFANPDRGSGSEDPLCNRTFRDRLSPGRIANRTGLSHWLLRPSSKHEPSNPQAAFIKSGGHRAFGPGQPPSRCTPQLALCRSGRTRRIDSAPQRLIGMARHG